MLRFFALKPNKYLIDYRLRLLSSGVIARYDNKIGVIGRYGAHYGPLCSVTVAAAAEENDKTAVMIRPQCLQRVFQRVRRVGIVDDYCVVAVGRDEFHASLDSVRRFHRLCAVIKAYSQCKADGYGIECVIDRKASRYRKAHGNGLPVKASCEGNALCRELYILCGKRGIPALGRICHELARCVFHHDIRPGIINIYAADTAGLKQHCLGTCVLLHGMVEIEMILRKIRERADRKIYPRDAAEHQRVGRDLHDDVGTACITHLRKKLLKLEALGRCALGVDKLVAYHISVCSDKSDLSAGRRLKQMLEKIGRSSFSVCSRDADDLHFAGGIPEKLTADECKRPSAVANQNIRYPDLRHSVADDDRRALFGGRRYVFIPVGRKAGYGDEHIARLCSARVVAYPAYLAVGRSGKLHNIYVFYKIR